MYPYNVIDILLSVSYLMEIGDIIKSKRLDCNLSQNDLAERSGVTQSMISKVEGGTAKNVSIEILRKLAKALNCLVIDLLTENDKKT